MNVRYHKQFVKHFKKRFGHDAQLKSQYATRLKLFMDDPGTAVLRDHALRGMKSGLRVFSVTGDVRVVYVLRGDTAYFLDIGTHNQVY